MSNIINHIDRLLGIEGESLGGFVGNTYSACCPLEFKLQTGLCRETYQNDTYNIQIEVNKESFLNNTICRQALKIKNLGQQSITLNKVNSLVISGIGKENGNWYNKGRILVHYTDCCWQGEFQWKTATLSDLSIYPFSSHANPAEKVFSSFGSWNSLKHYPMIFLEDTFENKTYIFEIESPDSWSITISNLKKENDPGSISVCLSAANMLTDGWQLTLGKGEEYISAPAIFGCINGSINEALAAISAYKRQTSNAVFNEKIPVVYNCYMNGIWSNPDETNLPPIIDAANELGAEIFCIDAGWHSPKDSKKTKGIGDWQPSDTRFPTAGLKGIVDLIKQKGMIPGLWLEIEACLKNTTAANNFKDCILKRNGKPIGKDRYLLNFSCKPVTDHLEKVFDCLYGMGIRYIKNDFNQTAGIGFDAGGLSRSEALRRNSLAFSRFIQHIRKKYPDLLIENCGSGGLRSGHAVLKDFNLQSISDQENYLLYPSIASGAVMCMPPEKTGIWCMPYPVGYNDRYNEITLNYFDKNMLKQTEFNMCNGFLGAMTLSGRIDLADSPNRQIIKNYISIYKDLREIIHTSHPVIIDGWLHAGEERIFAYALKSDVHSTALLLVWNLTDGNAEKAFDLGCLGGIGDIRWPCPNKDISYKLKDNLFNISFKSGRSASLFIIKCSAES